MGKRTLRPLHFPGTVVTIVDAVKGPSASDRRQATAHILVVDDEQEMCTSLQKLLSDNGFAVSTATSAQLGFQVLQQRTVNLVLCDIAMPDMSGLLFLSKISPDIPVIMMTAYASIETTRRAFKLGARDYLVKPFEFEELLVVVNQNLEAPHSGAAPAAAGAILLESKNPEFQAMLALARKFSQTDMPLLHRLPGFSGVSRRELPYSHPRRLQ